MNNQGKVMENVVTITHGPKGVDWQPYGADKRQGADILPLYNARDATNSSGPAAALLRYRPGATVPRHLHQGYELIFVLDGVLTNDTGDHTAGTLEVCPPGSSHALSSKNGCVFLVVWEQPVKVLDLPEAAAAPSAAQADRRE